jgi:large subunit ribosomal protein L7/L12
MRKQTILQKSLALLCCAPKLHRFHRFLTLRSLSSSPALDSDGGRGPFSPKILRLSDEIAALSDPEVALMSSTLRRKLGLPEPPPLGSMPMASPDWLHDGDSSGPDGAAAPAEKAAEKTSFCVKIEKFEAASKIKVIKEVRAATELGLKEAKEFVEKVPAVVKSGLSKEEAEQLMEKLKAAGATAVVE